MAMFPFVNLYVAPVENLTVCPVYPPQRQAQLDSTQNPYTRLQRYAVWKLLAYAVNHALGLPLEQLTLQLDANGKWSCKECCFSLSHCDGAVAVAVSDRPVGVDIEPAEREISPGIARKILTDAELSAYYALPDENRRAYLLEKWCARESLFKAGFDGIFQPRQSAVQRAAVHYPLVNAGVYCCAAATSSPEEVSIFINPQL